MKRDVARPIYISVAPVGEATLERMRFHRREARAMLHAEGKRVWLLTAEPMDYQPDLLRLTWQAES